MHKEGEKMTEKKQKIILILLAISVIFAGCKAKDAQMDADVTADGAYVEEANPEAEANDVVTQSAEINEDTELYGEAVEILGNAVGISAHIKEISEDKILISSDSDDFPGAFRVEVPENVYDASKLSEGAFIEIVMQSKEETDESGVLEYLAKDIFVIESEEDGVRPDKDVLLMGPPAIRLLEPLSSTYADIEIQSGNYTWNYLNEGEITGVIACGSHPLDDMPVEKLSLPQYRNMDEVDYFFNTDIAPDALTVRKWDGADIGNTDAEELSVIVYYYQSPLLGLEPGSVYEFTALWKEEKCNLRGFYGEASYTLITE